MSEYLIYPNIKLSWNQKDNITICCQENTFEHVIVNSVSLEKLKEFVRLFKMNYVKIPYSEKNQRVLFCYSQEHELIAITGLITDLRKKNYKYPLVFPIKYLQEAIKEIEKEEKYINLA